VAAARTTAAAAREPAEERRSRGDPPLLQSEVLQIRLAALERRGALVTWNAEGCVCLERWQRGSPRQALERRGVRLLGPVWGHLLLLERRRLEEALKRRSLEEALKRRRLGEALVTRRLHALGLREDGAASNSLGLCVFFFLQAHDEPTVPPELRHGNPVRGIHREHPVNEVPGPFRKVPWDFVLAGLDALDERADLVVIEGQAPAQEGIEQDPAGPDVDLGPLVGATLPEELRSRVVWGAAGSRQQLARNSTCRQTEVRDLDVQAVIQEEVFGLQVSVRDPSAMAVPDACDELLKEPPGLVLLKPALLHDVVEDVPSGDKLQNHDDVVLHLYDLLQFHHMSVVKAALVRDFVLQIFRTHLAPGDDFGGKHLACGQVLGYLYVPKRSSAKRVAEPILADVGVLHHRDGGGRQSTTPTHGTTDKLRNK